MLERFAEAKKAEIERLQKWKESAKFPPPLPDPRKSLKKALQENGPGAVVAEYKRASPSKGVINVEFGPVEIARAYKAGGATALSVLTEKTYFQGSLEYLFSMQHVGLPLLRKDFLLHPLQIEETAATPASALLLIVRMFEDQALLREMHERARAFGLEAVFEIFSQEELDTARKMDAEIIQVNNRDLSTLTVDLSLSKRLVSGKRQKEVWISASGISRPDQIRKMKELGFDGLLIGTSLMAGPDPGRSLRELLKHSKGGP
ncbi:MAG: indole-3-glycerol phosphate synthase TrpC [Desulfovibrionales bacterium]